MFDEEIAIMAIAGIGLILFLVTIFILSIVRYRRRVARDRDERMLMTKQFEQELLQSKLETQEETFRHIAKELHDNVGQLLSTTKMLISVTEINLTPAPDTLVTANATLGDAIQELRLLSRSLDQEWLEQFSFLDNLGSEVARINAGKTIQANVECNVPVPLRAEEQIMLFRIVQEAVHNAVRHASPTRIDVLVTGRMNALVVQVVNDGKRLPATFSGMGTNNMRHRAGLLGGTVEWKPLEASTVVEISLPIKRNQ